MKLGRKMTYFRISSIQKKNYRSEKFDILVNDWRLQRSKALILAVAFFIFLLGFIHTIITDLCTDYVRFNSLNSLMSEKVQQGQQE